MRVKRKFRNYTRWSSEMSIYREKRPGQYWVLHFLVRVRSSQSVYVCPKTYVLFATPSVFFSPTPFACVFLAIYRCPHHSFPWRLFQVHVTDFLFCLSSKKGLSGGKWKRNLFWHAILHVVIIPLENLHIFLEFKILTYNIVNSFHFIGQLLLLMFLKLGKLVIGIVELIFLFGLFRSNGDQWLFFELIELLAYSHVFGKIFACSDIKVFSHYSFNTRNIHLLFNLLSLSFLFKSLLLQSRLYFYDSVCFLKRCAPAFFQPAINFIRKHRIYLHIIFPGVPLIKTQLFIIDHLFLQYRLCSLGPYSHSA
jgi:hypothetical protein